MPVLPADQYALEFEDNGGNGLPLLYMHGGPGAAREKDMADIVDHQQWRYITFDQRGCGQSPPLMSIVNNTTMDTIADMERLRQHLGVDRWVVAGGSWGVTLALIYAQQYPQRVLGLWFRGVFLSRPQDIRWLFAEAARIYPDCYSAFNPNQLPLPELFHEYQTGLHGPEQAAYARRWIQWEDRLCGHQHLQMSDEKCVQMAVLEHHYLSQGGLLPYPVLQDIERIAAVPCEIVHGRYDMVCPAEQAYVLAQHLPDAALHIVESGDHGLDSEPMRQAGQDALQRLSQRVLSSIK